MKTLEMANTKCIRVLLRLFSDVENKQWWFGLELLISSVEMHNSNWGLTFCSLTNRNIYIYAFGRHFFGRHLDTTRLKWHSTFNQFLLPLRIKPMTLPLLAPCSIVWANLIKKSKEDGKWCEADKENDIGLLLTLVTFCSNLRRKKTSGGSCINHYIKT